MEPEILQYEKIVEEALRSVVRTALTQVADFGLPGDHSLYITFQTGHEGVMVPDRLRATYPEDMTIVIEHQFWDLGVFDEHFEVTLSFNRRKEHLVIPFEAVTSFADPSVPFGLKFDLGGQAAAEKAEADQTASDKTGESPDSVATDRSGGPAPKPGAKPGPKPSEAPDAEEADEEEDKPGEVVNLDSFRKNR